MRGDEAGAFVREEVGDGGVCAWVDDGALVLGGEEGGVPVFGAVGGEPAVVWEDDEGREVLVHGAEAVADPCAGAGEAWSVESGGLEERALGVDAGFSDHVMDEGEIVDDWAESGDRFAEHFAGLAVWFEVPDRAEPWAETVLEGFDGFAEVARLAVAFDEFRFEVEEVEVAGGTCHEELDDAFGAGRVLREGEGG